MIEPAESNLIIRAMSKKGMRRRSISKSEKNISKARFNTKYATAPQALRLNLLMAAPSLVLDNGNTIFESL
jgi:hypothetical protein